MQSGAHGTLLNHMCSGVGTWLLLYAVLRVLYMLSSELSEKRKTWPSLVMTNASLSGVMEDLANTPSVFRSICPKNEAGRPEGRVDEWRQ